jgi:hypothetical protein
MLAALWGVTRMATFECETCGCVEHLSTQPDCCSLCRSSWPTLIGGSVAYDDVCLEEMFDQDDLGEEDLVDHDDIGPHELIERHAYEDDAPASNQAPVIRALAVGLFCLVMLAVLPDGMQPCLAKHSYDTCHSSLNR